MKIIKRKKEKKSSADFAEETSKNTKKPNCDIKLELDGISSKAKKANILFFYRFL